jgi:hypothetical protein
VRRLIALRDARLYLAGQALSLLGDLSLSLAMGVWVKQLTGSSGAAGLTFVAFLLPQLASPLAGMVVDRTRRRPLLIAVNLASAVAVAPLVVVHDAGDVWIVYAVSLALGASTMVLGAGQSALLVGLLPGELLAHGNAALQTLREGLRLLAPLAGAGLFAWLGGGAVAALDAATFLAAAAALALMRLREPPPAPRGALTPRRARRRNRPCPGHARPAPADRCRRACGGGARAQRVGPLRRRGRRAAPLARLPRRAARRAGGRRSGRGGGGSGPHGAGGRTRWLRAGDGPRGSRPPAPGDVVARPRAGRGDRLRRRPVMDPRRSGHAASAQHAGAPAGPRVRGPRDGAGRPADRRGRRRRGARRTRRPPPAAAGHGRAHGRGGGRPRTRPLGARPRPRGRGGRARSTRRSRRRTRRGRCPGWRSARPCTGPRSAA